jgi:antitoxin MazE
MRCKVIRIGRSKGVRLSKAVLAKTGITSDVEIGLEGRRIVLMRPGWKPGGGADESGDESNELEHKVRPYTNGLYF